MACLRVLLVPPTPDSAAYDADVLLHLLVEVLRLLHLLLQLHALDQRLLEVSARHERAHVLETNGRLLGCRATRTPRMLLLSRIVLHRKVVDVLLELLLQPRHLLVLLLQ